MHLIKTCKICQQNKSLDSYSKHYSETGRVYYRSYCKPCATIRQIKYQERLRNQKQKPVIDQKQCSKCGRNLPVSQFHKDRNSKFGYSCLCKDCALLKGKARYQEIEAMAKPSIKGKVCTHCKTYKPIKNFCKCRLTPDGYNYSCRACYNKYRIENKEKINKQKKKRVLENPTVKLCRTLRSRVKSAIVRQSKTQKSAKTLELLGCSGEECMTYLETLFWPGMNRFNHGTNGWVIDHIIPIESFDKTDPGWQFSCFHYTNLQPLWEDDNLSKRDRLDWVPQESRHELPERLKK